MRTYELTDRLEIADAADALSVLQLPKNGRIKHLTIRKEGSVATIPGSILGNAYLGASMGNAFGMSLCTVQPVDSFPNQWIQEKLDLPYDRNTTVRWGGRNNSGGTVVLLLHITVEAP